MSLSVRRLFIRLFAFVLIVMSFIITPVIDTPTLVYADTPIYTVSDPYEDLKKSDGFDEVSLLLKTDITVIDFFEYRDKDVDHPLLVLYVYNPTSATLRNSTDNKVHIRIGGVNVDTSEVEWYRGWNTYKLEYLTSSADGKYVKYMVSLEDSKTINSLFSEFSPGSRYYDISEVKLVRVGDNTPSTYTVGYRYLFSDKDDTVVEKEKYDVIRVDELLPMVYRNIQEDECWSKQINSVAFTLPADVLEEYGNVSEINFEYYKYRTSPIVVSDKRNGMEIHERRNEWVGVYRAGKYDDQSNPMCIYWGDTFYVNVDHPDGYQYNYNNYYINNSGNKQSSIIPSKKEYRKLCYSFCSDYKRAVDYDVSSQALSDWIYSYADTYLAGQEYESLPIKDGKLPVELFEDYNNQKYGYKNVTVFSQEAFTDFGFKWSFSGFRPVMTFDVVVFDTIQQVNNADLSLSDEVLSDKYKINSSYVAELKNLSQNAEKDSEVPIVFHFDVSDYFCSPAYVAGEFGGKNGTENGHCYVAQTDVYLNFTFIDFTFCNGEKVTTLAVSSPVIDIIPPIQHPEVSGCASFDILYWLKMVGAIILLLLVLTLIFKLVRFLGRKDKDKRNRKKYRRNRRK